MLSMPRIVRPDPHRFRARNLVPPLDRPLADPLSETKNWRNFCAAGSAVNGNREPLLDLVSACPPAPNACAAPIPQLTFALGNGVCLSSAEEEPHLS